MGSFFFQSGLCLFYNKTSSTIIQPKCVRQKEFIVYSLFDITINSLQSMVQNEIKYFICVPSRTKMLSAQCMDTQNQVLCHHHHHHYQHYHHILFCYKSNIYLNRYLKFFWSHIQKILSLITLWKFWGTLYGLSFKMQGYFSVLLY